MAGVRAREVRASAQMPRRTAGVVTGKRGLAAGYGRSAAAIESRRSEAARLSRHEGNKTGSARNAGFFALALKSWNQDYRRV